MTLKKSLKVLIILLLVLITITSYITYQLLNNNININLNRPLINKVITQQFDNVDIVIGQSCYHYDRYENQFLVQLDNIKINGKRFRGTISQVILRYKPAQFLRLNFYPKIAVITQPDIEIFETNSVIDPNTVNDKLCQIFKLNYIKLLTIDQGTLKFLQNHFNISVNLCKHHNSRNITLTIKDQLDNVVTVHGILNEHTWQAWGQLNLKKLYIQDFAISSPAPVLLKLVLKNESNCLQHFQLMGKNVELNYDNLDHFDVKHTVSAENVFVNYKFPSGYCFSDGHLKYTSAIKLPARYQIFNHFTVDHNQLSLLHHSLYIYNFDVKQLNNFWPKKLVLPAREWLTDHFKEGIVTQAFVNITRKHHQDIVVNGKISLSNGVLSYLDSLPVISALNAEALFDRHGFNISVKQGIHNGLIISDGSVIIQDFDNYPITLTINAPVSGQLTSILAILNMPPLEYGKQFFKMQGYEGQVCGLFKMSFPLESPFKTSKISYHFAGNINQFHLNSILDIPISVTTGNLKVSTDNYSFSLTGKALINDAASSIVYNKILVPQLRQELLITALISARQLTHYNIDLTPYWQGNALTILSLNHQPGLPAKIVLYADLKNTSLTMPLLTKLLNDDARLDCEIFFKDNQIERIDNISLFGTDININAHAAFDLISHQLKYLRVKNFQANKSDFNLEYTLGKNEWRHIDITGKSLNLNGFDYSTHSNNINNLSKIVLNADVERTSIHTDYPIQNLKLHVIRNNNHVEKLDLSAQAYQDNNVVNLVNAQINTEKQISTLFLKSKYAGLLLKSLNINHDINDGNLIISAVNKTMSSNSLWQGELSVKKFSIKNMPVFARLITAIFPTGLADLRSDSGISFNLVNITFDLYPDKLKINHGYAYGHSLGLTFKGDISRTNPRFFNLTGSIIPAYFVNSLLSRIPLIGHLISGGEHEGLFAAAFTYKGLSNKVMVKVHPLSAFTPGFLRQIFIDHNHESSEANQ